MVPGRAARAAPRAVGGGAARRARGALRDRIADRAGLHRGDDDRDGGRVGRRDRCGLVDRGEEWRRHAEKWGSDLASNSKIRVGTVHSVKGMEADNVALLTTIGKRVVQGMEDADQHDEEHRIAYVGVTRTRRNLYVINEGRHGKIVPCMEVL